ncbi:GDSL esterase/lipase At4g26790 [Euphorbia lathyris]|uniref:GDSL esterase/lipase At4g26790 n=1 Tax=Euphorbia lathyris TaxID=212925 RepID=UPI003313EDDB
MKTLMNCFFSLHLLLQILTVNGKVPAIIIFGDSTVDTGNNNQIPTTLKSNFAPYGRDFIGGKATGRFSNGRVPGDLISEAFGNKPTIPAYLDRSYDIKDFATGVCFASAGTGYDNATSDVLNVMPMWKELEHYKGYQKKLRGYLGTEKANQVIREALYLISIGTNDFLENYYVLPRRRLQFSVNEYQYFLLGISRKFITDLYHLGARNIAVSGLPPMGCLPLIRTTNLFSGSKCIERLNKVAKDFNDKCNRTITELNKELPGIKLVLSNPYDIAYDIFQNPHSYGFENAAQACCGTGLFEMSYLCNKFNPFTCSDANKYVFWDSFHPTEKTNKIVVDYIVKNFLAQFL